MTILKPLFHREVSAGGNGNTIQVSKYGFAKAISSGRFKSTHTPTYR